MVALLIDEFATLKSAWPSVVTLSGSLEPHSLFWTLSAPPATDVLCVPVRSGFFADDQAAILGGAVHDGFDYAGDPVTPGFRCVRQAGEAVSVMLVLEDGQIGHGDCAAVQYSGVGGRDVVFDSAVAVETIRSHVAPILRGRELSDFRSAAAVVDALVIDNRPLHTAVRYGVTQALLDAVAKARRVTMAEVIQDEYETGIEIVPTAPFLSTPSRRTNRCWRFATAARS